MFTVELTQGEERDNMIRRMSVTEDDRIALDQEGEFFDWTEPTASYTGYNAVGYLPSCNRAAWITNGDPVWFDAISLEDAIARVESGDEDQLIN